MNKGKEKRGTIYIERKYIFNISLCEYDDVLVCGQYAIFKDLQSIKFVLGKKPQLFYLIQPSIMAMISNLIVLISVRMLKI
jgi:hypothetical protein